MPLPVEFVLVRDRPQLFGLRLPVDAQAVGVAEAAAPAAAAGPAGRGAAAVLHRGKLQATLASGKGKTD